MYVPIIKSQAGDIKSLQHLSEDIFNNTRPLIWISKTSEEECNKIVPRLNQCLQGKNVKIYFDFDSLGNNVQIVNSILQGLDDNITIIPVLSPNTHLDVVTILRHYIETLGVCLRIDISNRDANDIVNVIDAYINANVLEKNKIDLLLDCKYVTTENVDELFEKLTTVAMLYDIDNFRSFGKASGSFIPNLGTIPADTIRELPRVEQQLYDRTRADINVELFYSDYGNQHPLPGDGGQYQPSCSIKYTGTDKFVVFRGRQASTTERGSSQYFDKARQVITHYAYNGPNFSWGDNEIQIKADNINETRPGSSENWVSITMNRHITKIHSILN